jgi:hypothetical protein
VSSEGGTVVDRCKCRCVPIVRGSMFVRACYSSQEESVRDGITEAGCVWLAMCICEDKDY